MENNTPIKTILDNKSIYNYAEKSNILSLYYADKKNIEHNADFNNYVETKIKEFLEDKDFISYQLEKINNVFENKDFFQLNINEQHAFMASLKVNTKAVEITKLLGFLFDFEDTVITHHKEQKDYLIKNLNDFSRTLLETYNDSLIKKPYFSSLADIYKKLIRTSNNFKNYELNNERKLKLNTI